MSVPAAILKNLRDEETAANHDAIIIHSGEYLHWMSKTDLPVNGIRYPLALKQFSQLAMAAKLNCKTVASRAASLEELKRVHSHRYISEISTDYFSSEWDDARPDQFELAKLLAGGTLVALNSLLAKETNTAIHFAGAKHHAQRDYPSGFCIFNDFAIAADIATKDYGLRVAILDIDAHHGDGTENLTDSNPNVLTYSIHEFGIFPGTGKRSDPANHLYNWPLKAGDGDLGLLAGVLDFIPLATEFEFDLLFLACGADGHKNDPLTYLEYSVSGYVQACHLLRTAFPSAPILFGGAGGYRPENETPEIWSKAAFELAKPRT